MLTHKKTFLLLGALLIVEAASATTTIVLATDSIFLAGRTDLTAPVAAFGHHAVAPPEHLQETFPNFVPVTGLHTYQMQAGGCAHPFIGYGCNIDVPGAGFGPNGVPTHQLAVLNSFGGISGYKGPANALVGVFLGVKPLVSKPPETLGFTEYDYGTTFTFLAPALGQIFYIGDGAGKQFQAPAAATRLFFGIADGYAFQGNPGWYEDNDGSFWVQLTHPVAVDRLVAGDAAASVPEPSTFLLLGSALVAIGYFRRIR